MPSAYFRKPKPLGCIARSSNQNPRLDHQAGTTSILGVALLGETVSVVGIVGSVLILVGLVVVSRPPKTSSNILLEI